MPEALISRITSRGPGVGSGKSLSSSFRSPRNTTPFMDGSSGDTSSCVPGPLSRSLTVAERRTTLAPAQIDNFIDNAPGGFHGRVRDADLYLARRQDGRGYQALHRIRLSGAPEGRSGQEADRLFPGRHRHDQPACAPVEV